MRLYAFYEPLRTFSYIALPFLLAGLFTWLRFLFFVLAGESGIGRYIQSLTIGTGLLLVGVITLLFGIQADIASKHRQLSNSQFRSGIRANKVISSQFTLNCHAERSLRSEASRSTRRTGCFGGPQHDTFLVKLRIAQSCAS
jgi:hypothetical protein